MKGTTEMKNKNIMTPELMSKLEKVRYEIHEIEDKNNMYISGYDMVLTDNETELEIDF